MTEALDGAGGFSLEEIQQALIRKAHRVRKEMGLPPGDEMPAPREPDVSDVSQRNFNDEVPRLRQALQEIRHEIVWQNYKFVDLIEKLLPVKERLMYWREILVDKQTNTIRRPSNLFYLWNDLRMMADSCAFELNWETRSDPWEELLGHDGSIG